MIGCKFNGGVNVIEISSEGLEVVKAQNFIISCINLNPHVLILHLFTSNTSFKIQQPNYVIISNLSNARNYPQPVSMPLVLLLVHVKITALSPLTHLNLLSLIPSRQSTHPLITFYPLTPLSSPLPIVLHPYAIIDVDANAKQLLTDTGDAITTTSN